MTLLKRRVVTGLFHDAPTASDKAHRIRAFLQEHRHGQHKHDHKAEWLLHHGTLAAQAQHIEAELHDTLDTLLASDAISHEDNAACADEASVLQHLRFEDTAECRETLMQLRSAVQACLEAGKGNAAIAQTIQEVHGEVQAELELQQRHVALLHEDAQDLMQHLRCAQTLRN